MNDPTLTGPCAEYEHEIVDLHDGELPAGRARAVSSHLEGCARCRAWAGEVAALDARLAAALPRPVLSPDFDARLRERIASLATPVRRPELRSRLEQEHDALVDALRRSARRRAVLGAVATAAATLALLATARGLLAQAGDWLPSLADGSDQWLAFGTVGVAISAVGLAWSVARSRGVDLSWLR
jgi:anti-sigma factor RsiW